MAISRLVQATARSARLRMTPVPCTCSVRVRTNPTFPAPTPPSILLAPGRPRASALLYQLRQSSAFHTSPTRRDIFFVTIPAIKQVLLTVTRFSLVALAVTYRWKLAKRFPAASRTLWQVPIIAVLLVLALGLNQSPKTARWRLLLMSEREELDWSNQRLEELLSTNAMDIIPPNDPRLEMLTEVCTRLIQALQDESPISFANFPREEIVHRSRERDQRKMIQPSATTQAITMPFLPETSNPEKLIVPPSWDIFVVDAPKINAFVLPSTDIFVYSGLLELVEDDDSLLAAVIAHEISHVTERHSVESLGFLALSGVVFDVLRGASWALTLSFPIVGDALATCFNFLDTKVGRLAYSRKLETEADTLGLELMAKAGYDPRAALRLWEILNEVENDLLEHGGTGSMTDDIALLRTHPTGEVRMQAIKDQLPAAIKLYDQALADEAAKEALLRQHRPVVVVAKTSNSTPEPPVVAVE